MRLTGAFCGESAQAEQAVKGGKRDSGQGGYFSMPSTAAALQPALGMPGLSAGAGPLDRLSLHPLGSGPLGQHGSSLAPPALPAGLPGGSMHPGLGESGDGHDDAPPMKRAKAAFAGARVAARSRARSVRAEWERARIGAGETDGRASLLPLPSLPPLPPLSLPPSLPSLI